MFSLVLGILIAIAIVLFAMSRCVGSSTQAEHLKAESLRVTAVEERTQPAARVAVAGEDNSTLAIVETKGAGAAPAAAALPQDGKGVFETACAACHGAGIAGAPKMGDK